MITQWIEQNVNRRLGLFSFVLQADDLSMTPILADKAALDALLKERLLDARSVFKDDRTTTVACINEGALHSVLKRYNPRTNGHKLSRAFRQTRARRCWKMSYAFARAGLNVAQPLLMYEQRFGPIRLDAYFVNAMLVGEELLSALPTMSDDQQNSVVQSVKQAFEIMHKAKLTHGDMKASNLLWVDGELFFIDLDAAQRHSSYVTWNVSHNKDKKRFLKNWADQPELLALFDDL